MKYGWDIVERIGERAEHCPIPTSMPKREEMKLFYKYWVFLPIKWLEKKKEIFGLKPTLFRINKKNMVIKQWEKVCNVEG